MRDPICIIMALWVSGNVLCQNAIIDDSAIPALDSIIRHLEEDYRQKGTMSVYSFPQTIGSYFEIKTKTPDVFISALKKSENLQQLKDEFLGLEVDEDLLIIKNEYLNYEGERTLEIKSFEIENNARHLINSQYYTIEQVRSERKKTEVYYSAYQEKWISKDITIIKGFYLNAEFRSTVIPNTYSDWISYTDVLVNPETPIFHDHDTEANESGPDSSAIVDSLVGYYELKTNKPPYNKEQDYGTYREMLSEWQSKKEYYSDSLFRSDAHFKTLLLEALEFAEKNKVSNGDMEDFTALLVSEKRALELMRHNRKVGTCSFDNGPLIQQKRIARLAAKTKNWEVFIKSFMNVMNDHVPRVANSNIASNARKTNIEELTKLDLDVHKILLGSNLRIKDSLGKHYFSEGSKVAKAYAGLNAEDQNDFEHAVFEILQDKEMDAFNKLHFYNTLKNYQYFINDSIKKVQLEDTINNLITFLPREIKSRIENPDKQLYDLLHRESQELDKFNIKSSTIGSIWSYSFGGDCWQAELIDKNADGKIIYDLTMAVGEEITPLQNFLDKKNDLSTRVLEHGFLQEIIQSDPENKVYIQFTTDRSFVNHRDRVTESMPKDLVSTLNFQDAIALYVSFPNRKYVRFVLLNNGHLLVLGIPKDFDLPGYTFEELMTEEVKSFLSTSYKSFKIFGEDGNMLN